MKTITVFELSDGSIVKDKVEAEKKEKILARKKAIEDLVDDKCWSEMSKSDITDFIFESFDALKEIQ